jgi:hypothetical protein
MTNPSREEIHAELLEGGMDPEEVENFLTPGREAMKMKIQLPPAEALAILEEITKTGILVGPMKFEILFSKNRRDKVAGIIKSKVAPGTQVIEGQEFEDSQPSLAEREVRH